MAYPGDGKKRRSFLPAPKKSPTSSLPPQPSFPTGPISSGSYTILQRAYVSKLPGAQSSSSSVSPSSSLSSISLPSSSISSASIPIGDKQIRQLPNEPDENRCGVGLRVGARVKIGGIKPGILRYLGTTHLAPGIFCGIELLEADGKHDGEVNGHRYFYCPPNCGIFAPKEKVCIDSSVSSRLSSESDGNLYSSNESLTERTYKAFRSFEEGELEAVDCSVLSPESPHGETGKRKVETPPDWGSRSTDSIDSQDSSFFQSKSKSRLPRSGKGSNIPSPQGHSLRSPGTGPLSYVAFGYQRVHEDNHASQNQGKDGHETKGKDIQNLEKGRAASRIQELYKDKQTTEKDAQIVDENESKRQFLQGDSLRHVRSYQTRPDDKQYLNFASDPRDPEPQRSADRKNTEDRSIYKRHSHSQYSGDEGSPQNKDSRLDSTFEIIPSPLPSCHPANRTFDVVSASPSVTSIREGRDDFPLTSTPEPGCNTTRFEGRSPFIADPQSSGPSSLSSSGTDAEGRDGRLSATFSLSDSQVQSSQTLLHDGDAPNTSFGDPQVNVIDPGSTRDNHNVGSVQSRAYYQQGGYTSSAPGRCGGDGNSRGLLPSQPQTPRSSCKSASYIVSSQGEEQSSLDVTRSDSYTVCAGHKDSKSIPDSTDPGDVSGKNTAGTADVSSDPEKERRPTHSEDGPSARQSSVSAPQSSQPENVVVAAAASLRNTVSRSHSSSPCGRKVFSAGSSHEENGGESSSSSGPPSSGGGDHRLDHLDDSSTGASPEVSQALEWDYGQEFIDGKIPPPLSRHHLNRHARNHSSDVSAIMTTSSSTGTSESLSDALLRDVSSEPSSDTEMTPASNCSLADDSDQFEPPENDFENIDSLEDLDFPMLGKITTIPVTSASSAGVSASFATAAAEMTTPPTAAMTDSGISERDESEMFKSTTSAASSSTLCGGGAGDNSFSDDCSRDDDHSSSSVLAGNPVVTSSATGSTSSGASMKGAGSDSSQETLCVADTPGSVEDKEFLSEDGEGDVDSAHLKALPLEIAETERSSRCQHDSIGDDVDITSGSPASVVSLEDVTLAQDKTITCDMLGKGKPINTPDPSVAVTNPPAPNSMPSPTCISQVIPGERGLDAAGEEHDNQDPAGLLSTRKERPISLISTTSADTGYAPDTDSEIGTLTFNSPNTDWLDRCGVAHPTTFAPPEELGFNGDVPSATRELESSFQRTSTPVGNSALGKPSYLHDPGPGGSVDDASDLTSGPEQDDRAEADQVYGDPVTNRSASGSGVRSSVPRSRRDTAQTTSSADAPSSSQASFEDEEEEDDDEEDQEYDEDDNIDDLVPCQDLEFSFKVNAPIDFFAATSSAAHSDEDEEGETTVKRNPKRKAMTITRKRSENISHKMPNTRKVTSRLADYIKTSPVPSRPRDEQQNDKVARNNAKNISPKKRLSAADIGNRPNTGNGTPNSRRGSTVDKGGAGDGDVAGGESSRRSQVTPQPPKPAIKRAPPKSKWGDIMSQIESGKGATKPKPKSEIKSSLAAYLNTPPPSLADKGNQQQEGDEPSTHSSTSNSNQTPPRKKFESRIKPLPPPPPKIDLSKVKSKLGVPTAASATKAQPKRDSQASNSNANSRRSLSRESSPANGARKGGKRMSEPHILQGKQNKQLLSAANTRTNSVADSSIISSARSSITDLSISAADHLDADGTPSKRGSTDVSRKLSTNSTKSEVSELKNGHARSNRRTIEIKSNAPPNTPLSLPARAIEIHLSNGGSATLAGNNSSRMSTPSPVIVKPIKPKTKTSAVPSSAKTNTTNPARATATSRNSDVKVPTATPATDKARNSSSSKLDCRAAVVSRSAFPSLPQHLLTAAF